MKRSRFWAVAAILSPIIICSSVNAGLVIPDTELINSWGVNRIGAGQVHASGNKGAGVKIGIIDSGIDYGHPEFSGRFAGGYDFVNNDEDPFDDYGHGTWVAGIIGAADDGAGVVGVAPESSLYAYKVFDSSGNGSLDDIIAALDRAILDGIDVVNMSFASVGDPGPDLLDACNRALAAGIVLVAAAGNFGTFDLTADNVGFPAVYESVIAVSGTTDTDSRALGSSTGPDVELAAPGFQIQTTDKFGLYTFVDGTSMAAPHVAGTAALLIEAGWTNVRERLIATAYDLGDPGRDPVFGYGLVDAAAAVIPAPSALGLALLGFLLVRTKCRPSTPRKKPTH